MTSPQSLNPRKISFKDNLLDQLYTDINSELYKKSIDRPFHWEEVDGTSIMFIYDSVRFVSHRGENKIFCEMFNDTTSGWENCESKIGEYLPVMWPIKNARVNTNLLSNFLSHCTVGSVVQKHLNAFYLQNPQYACDPEKKKIINHLSFVCEKKWQHRKRQVSVMNLRGANRFWWSNFVDRSVFRTLVSVVGNRSSVKVSWKDFVDLSSHTQLSKIQENVKNLGFARQSLVNIHLDQWANISLEQAVPNGLQSVWTAVQQEPPTIQETLVNITQRFSLSQSELQTIWRNYTLLKEAGSTWSTRELNMLMNVGVDFCEKSCDGMDGLNWGVGVAQKKKDIKTVLPYIHTCVKLWRASNPDLYRKWSASHQNEWRRTVIAVCKISDQNKTFSVPATPNFEPMRCMHEKNLLNEALEASGVSLDAPKRRRAM